MKMTSLIVTCCSVICLLDGVARAGIRFQSEDITVATALDQPTATVQFKFTNAGQDAIVIKGLTTSCGCTTAESDKKIYLGGESGVISATVTIGTAAGKLDKNIVVETSDGEHPTTKLTVHVMIPNLVSFSPDPYVRWDQGAAAKPQTVKVKVESLFPLKIIGVKSWHDRVRATLKEIAPGKAYEVTVWPTDTQDVLDNAIELLNDAKPPKKVWLLVHVKPKGQS